LIILIIRGEEYKSWSLLYAVFATFHHCTTLWSKYSPQHPILKHP
jgi:hypothetical protein